MTLINSQKIPLRQSFGRGVSLALLLTALVLLGGVAVGQDLSSSLRGLVTDPSGAVIAGATATLSDPQTKFSRVAVTDGAGFYQFAQVPPGSYVLRLEHSGFLPLVREEVQLLVATPTTLNLSLAVGPVSAEIRVEGTVAINSVDATHGNAFNEKEVKTLPFLARNPVNLLTLQPGVIFTGESDTDLLFLGSILRLNPREGAVNGIKGNQSNVTVDGVDANDWQTQAAFTSALPLSLDALQEFRVTTANANATDGTASGAQVALVTKSGSNDWHGNLREYHRNTATAANAFFNNRIGLAKPKLLRNIFGGSLGGRLVRDRAFFFFDYEGRRDASEEPVVRRVPTETFKQGILRYRTTTGATATLTPDQIKALDPLKLGVNQRVLPYLALYPQGNDPSGSNDGALNNTGFRFNAPIRVNNNIYTARFDFNLTANGRQKVFWRGTLGDIAADQQAAQFPGLGANSALLNNSKGFAIGYTAQFSPKLINNLQLGFTRQGITQSGGQGISYPLAQTVDLVNTTTRAESRRVPVTEISDDLTWLRGNHTFQVGGIGRLIRTSRVNETNAFASYGTAAVRGPGNPGDALLLDSDPNNNPASVPVFIFHYYGIVGAVQQQLGPMVFVDPNNKTSFLPSGAPLRRRYIENQFETYGQDVWRLRPHLTLTLGLRYHYAAPLYEASGAQLRPTIETQDYFNRRQRDMLTGVPSDATPLLSFQLAGKANDAPAWWQPDKNNFAPRFAFAYSPRLTGGPGRFLLGAAGQSVLRGGFSVNFDRVGGPITVSEDGFGNFGFSTLLRSSAALGIDVAPRFTGSCAPVAGCSGFPTAAQLGVPDATGLTFPLTPSRTTSRSTFAVDTHLRTPYNMNFTLSLQRELPQAILLDVSYVGTQGRKQLTKVNTGEIYGFFTDPKSGQNLWGVMNQIVNLIGPNPFSPAIDPRSATALAGIQPIAFIENLLTNLPNHLAVRLNNNLYRSLTPTQAFYSYVALNAPDYLTLLGNGFDRNPVGGSPWNASVDPQGDGYVLFQPQLPFEATWLNWGTSSYHSLQISLRRNLGRALFGVNYVLSKSIDTSSAAENGDVIDQNNAGFGNMIPNPFRPKAQRAVSDFDLRHNFNAHAVYDLPFGRGRQFASNAGSALEQVIGGWQVVGVWRWRSGFPLSPALINNATASISSPATIIGPLQTALTGTATDGLPNLFPDPAAARALVTFTRPGEVGSRNGLRGPGYFAVDLGLHKQFRLPWGESHRLEFRWQAFNAFNNVNFSSTGIELRSTQTSFGRFSATAGPRGGAREMEFALRYSF
jgi:hypothetical protein